MRLTVKDGHGSRIDAWLSSALTAHGLALSRSYIKGLLDEGRVLVNGRLVKPSHKLKDGWLVDISLPSPAPADIIPENIPLDIIHEDASIIVINKPQGMVVHPAPGHYSGTAVNALLHHRGADLSGINGILRPGIVHRLDKDTSGLLLIAKNDTAHRHIAKQLADRAVKRQYKAIVIGKITEPVTVNQPISRHKVHRKKMAVDPAGREAITHFSPISHSGKYTLTEARLETGRTHQVRVHAAYLRRPILGDTVYGPQNQPFKLAGQVLHAERLAFVHPVTGEHAEFEAPLPEYFRELLNKLDLTEVL